MPNIGSVLKQEISRIARKETRSEIETIKKATVQHRRYIAALKQQVIELERKIASLSRQERVSAAMAEKKDAKPVRFVPKGLRSMRERLGLSVNDLARLLGVSGQTVYNWEARTTKPRSEQLQVIAQLRAMGKREVRLRLQQAAPAD